MTRRSTGSILFLMVLLSALFVALTSLSTQSLAQGYTQSTPAVPTETAPPPLWDGDLTDAEFQAMLGKLSDVQVRDILIREFSERNKTTAESGDGLLSDARTIGETLSTNTRTLLAKWPQIGSGFNAVLQRLDQAGGFGVGLLAILVSFAVGFTARFFWRRKAAQRQARLAERNIDIGSYGSVATIGDGVMFLVIEISSVVVFGITAMAALYIFFNNGDIRIFASSYIAFMTIVLLVKSFVDIMFPREWPMYRLVATSDDATRLLHGVVIWLGGLWAFEASTTDLMARFGAPEGVPNLFSLILSIVWVVSALTGVYLISRATADLLPPREERGLTSFLTRRWAVIMSGAVWLIWVLFAGGGLVSGNVDAVAQANLKMILLMFGFWAMYRILVHYLRAQPIEEEIAAAIRRAVRTGLVVMGVLISLAFWGLDPASLNASGLFGQWLQGAISVAMTALIGWAIWDFSRTLIDRRIAAEHPEDEEEEGAEGEGGLGASRTATLLPLLRSFALVAIGLTCIFTAASSMGVNVAPLVAGAGVLGLAIGFGAQTLVKDVVSGVFFLIDDAFRRGEYIDLGSVKGTVERISVRSLQLRHHLGAVHTIPFGDISALTNYSRDWVIMKLPLRLTFDTDPQMVKKIVKRIGAEFMEDEELGRGLLEPPKSQGVIQMEDSAMILRVKFKAVPGKQFVIRRELLHRIRAAFEEAGIRFANREVTIRVNEDASHAERLEAAGAAATSALEAPQPQPER